ncbi:MAG: hypothetical protein RLY86_1337 [Pseudomonadota bacterium]|jgi:tRNA (mo5U34)-methyltransferase
MVSVDLERRIRDLDPWFHNLNLGGIRTAPDHFLFDYPGEKWRRFAHAIPADLTGRTVLDIGCNAGFHAVEMKKRGADRVVGIDSDPRYLAQAALVAEVRGVEIELRNLSVYDIATLGERFDLVLFLGVFYHLRHPLLALDLIREYGARDLLVFQSMLRGSAELRDWAGDYSFQEREPFDDPAWPRMHFIEHAYCGDWTNWWVPNTAGAAAMLRSAGFAILDQPEEEVFLCRVDEAPYGPGAVHPVRPGDPPSKS